MNGSSSSFISIYVSTNVLNVIYSKGGKLKKYFQENLTHSEHISEMKNVEDKTNTIA